MNEDKCAKASRKQIIIMALGITALALLMLVSIAGATRDSDAWINKGNALSNLNQSEESIVAYDKAIEIDTRSSWGCQPLAIRMRV